MDAYRSARQFGVSVILLTMLFRLFETGIAQGALRLRPEAEPEIRIEKETGLRVRSLSVPHFLPFPFIPESSEPLIAPVKPEFRPEDAEGIRIVNTGSRTPDAGALLAGELDWNLADGQAAVLILHTHTSESYTRDGGDYAETAPYRTLAEEYNMLSIGDRVAELLEQAGIRVIHDREFHDYPNYNTAYTHARKAAQAILKENETIRLVLDLHRDAAESGSGQLRTSARIGTQEGAQLMFVLGCGNANLPNPEWEHSLALALKLQSLLERSHPGICRPLSIRPQRFNQDLLPGFLLVEVGAAGNTHPEALLAADQLAAAIIELKRGSR